MAVVNIKSTAVTNAEKVPKTLSTPNISRGKLHQSVGVVAVGAADSIASAYRLCRVLSGDRIATLALFCTAITSAAANIGLYETLDNGGLPPITPTLTGTQAASVLAAAQSLATALNGVNITYSVTTLANMEKRVWELLGLTADPGKSYDLVLTLTAAATAAGTLGAHVTTVSGE
jgi:hypothetical protein